MVDAASSSGPRPAMHSTGSAVLQGGAEVLATKSGPGTGWLRMAVSRKGSAIGSKSGRFGSGSRSTWVPKSLDELHQGRGDGGYALLRECAAGDVLGRELDAADGHLVVIRRQGAVAQQTPRPGRAPRRRPRPGRAGRSFRPGSAPGGPPSRTSRNSSRGTCRPSTTRQSVSGVDRISPIGPHSQLQKIAATTTEIGESPVLWAVEEWLDHLPGDQFADCEQHQRSRWPWSNPGLRQRPGQKGSKPEIHAPIYGTKRSSAARTAHRAGFGTPISNRPPEDHQSEPGIDRQLGQENSGSSGGRHRPSPPSCGAGRTIRTGG